MAMPRASVHAASSTAPFTSAATAAPAASCLAEPLRGVPSLTATLGALSLQGSSAQLSSGPAVLPDADAEALPLVVAACCSVPGSGFAGITAIPRGGEEVSLLRGEARIVSAAAGAGLATVSFSTASSLVGILKLWASSWSSRRLPP